MRLVQVARGLSYRSGRLFGCSPLFKSTRRRHNFGDPASWGGKLSCGQPEARFGKARRGPGRRERSANNREEESQFTAQRHGRAGGRGRTQQATEGDGGRGERPARHVAARPRKSFEGREGGVITFRLYIYSVLGAHKNGGKSVIGQVQCKLFPTSERENEFLKYY